MRVTGRRLFAPSRRRHQRGVEQPLKRRVDRRHGSHEEENWGAEKFVRGNERVRVLMGRKEGSIRRQLWLCGRLAALCRRRTVVAHRTGQPVLGHDLQDLLLHLARDLSHLPEQFVPGAPEGLNK